MRTSAMPSQGRWTATSANGSKKDEVLRRYSRWGKHSTPSDLPDAAMQSQQSWPLSLATGCNLAHPGVFGAVGFGRKSEHCRDTRLSSASRQRKQVSPLSFGSGSMVTFAQSGPSDVIPLRLPPASVGPRLAAVICAFWAPGSVLESPLSPQPAMSTAPDCGGAAGTTAGTGGGAADSAADAAVNVQPV